MTMTHAIPMPMVPAVAAIPGLCWWRVALVVVFGLFHSELFAVVSGADEVLVRQAGLGLLTGAALASLGWLLWRGTLLQRPYVLWPLILLCTILTVSLFANTAFYPKPLKDWLPAHYIYLPVLQFYVLLAVRATDRDIIWGLILTGVIAALLMTVYYLGLWDALRYYARRSIFGLDVSRIVIMKYEFFFASLGLFAILLTPHLPMWLKTLAGTLLALCLALQIQVVQSRQGLIAMFVGMAVLLLVDRRSLHVRPFLVRGAVVLIGLLCVPLALDQYLELLTRRDLLESRELNVAVRFHTFDHYAQYFIDTMGVGFGMSAPSGRINNVIAEGRALAVNFTDLGLYGAFMQFGVIGGLLAVFLTLQAIFWGIRTARALSPEHAWRPALLGAYFIGWLCVPVQINAFTLPSSIHFGALAVYLAWYYRGWFHRLPRSTPTAPRG
ncbi:hypothetical protein HL658_27930 [Azospirillum sp. RWY-5-1]|uniref:O-antigen ligase domain-containing protein n=1 Tax=Azospirillum oleiclasticum TaxID=2735135 RepID=A0ABX2THS9_9PROT|nr:hypothetical protein [Azospirillum oleiclasticum]NYZ16389.1 hypothetical protein [Azospirillum oleiclasticum]NYZ23895.1 hypothetical protein [Azospirillum oleiclasticum]